MTGAGKAATGEPVAGEPVAGEPVGPEEAGEPGAEASAAGREARVATDGESAEGGAPEASEAAASGTGGPPAGEAAPSCAVGTEGAEPGFVRVALPVGRLRSLTYRLPEALRARAVPGMRVLVPLGPRTLTGFIVERVAAPAVDPRKLKDIRALPDAAPLLEADLLELARWIARYYRCGLGRVVSSMLPPSLLSGGRSPRKQVRYQVVPGQVEVVAALDHRHARRWHEVLSLLEPLASFDAKTALDLADASRSVLSTLTKRGHLRRVDLAPELPAVRAAGPPLEVALRPAQAEALAALRAGLDAGAFATFLLWGITGSGKTEVYARAAEHCLAAGRTVLFLVPEIALTPQLTERLAARLGPVAVLHSDLSGARREQAWKALKAGEIKVALGARSAVFAPLPRLGLVVVDEEHETTFKQDSAPRYHARDVAILRARSAGAVCVLGSATPALESFANARSGKYGLLRLPERATEAALPEVHTVDLSREGREIKRFPVLSRLLVRWLDHTLKAGEQAILFLNRRGYSTFIHCPSCGFVVKCRSCDIALTYHKGVRKQSCHYCGLAENPSEECPECHHPRLNFFGLGTEKVTEIVAATFPKARVARVDGDVAASRGEVARRLADFRRRELDILVGTQMLAKGHDFPHVTLVGVVAADTALNFPDFRAAERTFQLLTQVAGRAGRAEKPGRVVIQSFQPSHYAVETAVRQDYAAFYEAELPSREALGYPPFGRLAKVLVEGRDEDAVRKWAFELASRILAKEPPGARVLGPVPSPISRIQERYRWQFLVKAVGHQPLRAALACIDRGGILERGSLRVIVDVDPVFLL